MALATRSEESLREVAEECEALCGRPLVVLTDVTDQAAVQELARRTVEHFWRIDVWVNNAGVILYGHFEKTPAEAYRQMIETNLFGQIHGARAALAHFQKRGTGVLINLSSVWGRLTSPYVSAYVTSKFVIRTFSECLRQEFAGDDDIHVVTILPQSVDTPIWRQAGNYSGRAARPVSPVSTPEAATRILRCAQDLPPGGNRSSSSTDSPGSATPNALRSCPSRRRQSRTRSIAISPTHEMHSIIGYSSACGRCFLGTRPRSGTGR